MSDRTEFRIEVYRRQKRAAIDADVEQFPFQADIAVWAGSDHHGIGKTAAEALSNAANHWWAYEQRKAAEAAPIPPGTREPFPPLPS